MLVMTGRVTMLGLARWAGKGGSYRTVQRFFGVCPTFYTERFEQGCTADDVHREPKFAHVSSWGHIGIYPK